MMPPKLHTNGSPVAIGCAFEELDGRTRVVLSFDVYATGRWRWWVARPMWAFIRRELRAEAREELRVLQEKIESPDEGSEEDALISADR